MNFSVDDHQANAAVAAPQAVVITVVIPTFNRSGLLRRAVDSVRCQTYSHWRLVVVDNASPDDTPEVMAEFMRNEGRIRYHRHGENIGMLANWEFSIAQVETDYFSLLCDDDYLLPDFLEAAAREMTRRPELGLCFGVANIVDDKGKKISIAPNPMKPGYYPAGAGAAAMMTLQHPATPAIVFRTECFRTVGGFDRRSHYVADLDMILRVAFRFPVMFFEEESACYVVHPGNSFKDVSGWHPGLLNLVGNLKKLERIDLVYVRKVFRSFSEHAVVPLFAQFLRSPISKFKPDISLSACRCAIEMCQVSNTLFGLLLAILRRVNSGIRWRLKVLRQLAGALLKSCRQPGNQAQEVRDRKIKGNSWLRASLYWISLAAFLVIYGLAEFLLVNILFRPMAKVRGLLARPCRESLRPD